MAGFERRLKTELDNALKPSNRVEGITLQRNPQHDRVVDVTITGPVNTPYEGGIFHLQYFYSEGFPLKPPQVYFVTKIWHPNIDYLGRICLDTISSAWTPAFQIYQVCLSIQLLLSSPNASDPLDGSIAAQFQNDPAGAAKKAKEWTKRFATASAVNKFA